jgi:DNA invertase Pin-like site-specific DNA recombinase
MKQTFVGVCRVSTKNQGESKLGLQGQRAEMERWAELHGHTLITIMDEVASGSWPLRDRPVMSAAIAMAKKLKAKVLVTKTDRCSRNLQIIDRLMHEQQIVTAIDLGNNPDEFIGTVYAGLAVKERKMIGLRTKAGLAAAKARGVVLGNRTNLKEAQTLGQQSQSKRADNFAQSMKVTIQAFQKAGMTLQQIADELNAREISTARGGNWHTSTLRNVISRW